MQHWFRFRFMKMNSESDIDLNGKTTTIQCTGILNEQRMNEWMNYLMNELIMNELCDTINEECNIDSDGKTTTKQCTGL